MFTCKMCNMFTCKTCKHVQCNTNGAIWPHIVLQALHTLSVEQVQSCMVSSFILELWLAPFNNMYGELIYGPYHTVYIARSL